VSVTHDVDMNLVLPLDSGAAQFMVTWEFVLAPSGIPKRGPDVSGKDTRLVAVSDEVAGSVEAETLAWTCAAHLAFTGR
jgi:hypothetical protein